MNAQKKACPFCGSTDTQKQSDFGTSVMVRQFYCSGCRTVFEWIKWGDSDKLDVPDFLQTIAPKN
jgi:hypothetical protein